MYIEIIDYILISRKHICKEEIVQIFVLKNKFGLLYINLNIEFKYCLLFFYNYNIFLNIDSLTVVEELTKTNKIVYRILFIKSFKYLFQAR